MPDEGDRGQAELLDGGDGVIDIRLAAIRPVGGLLAAAVAPLVQRDRAVPGTRSRRAVAAQWEARPIRPWSSSTPGRCSPSSSPPPILGGSVNSQAASRTPCGSCYIDAPHHVPWHPQSSLEQLHTIEPLFERTVPARNTPRSSDLAQGLAAPATGRHLPGGGPHREGGPWGQTLGARGSGSWVGDMGRQGPGCSQRRGPGCLPNMWMHPSPLPGQDRPMHGHASGWHEPGRIARIRTSPFSGTELTEPAERRISAAQRARRRSSGGVCEKETSRN